MTQGFLAFLLIAATGLFTAPASADPGKKSQKPNTAAPVARNTTTNDGVAEARLIEVYRLTGHGKTREALARAESLVRDYPNFQLAQLVYGDRSADLAHACAAQVR